MFGLCNSLSSLAVCNHDLHPFGVVWADKLEALTLPLVFVSDGSPIHNRPWEIQG